MNSRIFFLSHAYLYLFIIELFKFYEVLSKKEKNWMLMTYYCPTHGDSGLVKPIQLTKKEISKTFLKKGRSSKN